MIDLWLLRLVVIFFALFSFFLPVVSDEVKVVSLVFSVSLHRLISVALGVDFSYSLNCYFGVI